MPEGIDDLRLQLTDAALRRSWEAVQDIIVDLEEGGVLWGRLHGYGRSCGNLSEWLKGCEDWEREAAHART